MLLLILCQTFFASFTFRENLSNKALAFISKVKSKILITYTRYFAFHFVVKDISHISTCAIVP